MLPEDGLMDVDVVEKAIGRSRPSIYRYANTSPQQINMPFNPNKLNPELRPDRNTPLQFHPTEVARFVRDVLKIKPVIIEMKESTTDLTHKLLTEILEELRQIHYYLKQKG